MSELIDTIGKTITEETSTTVKKAITDTLASPDTKIIPKSGIGIYAVVVNAIVELLILTKKLLNFTLGNEYVRYTQIIKKTIITILFVIICIFIYIFIMDLFANVVPKDEVVCANQKPMGNYIVNEFYNFYNQTIKLVFGVENDGKVIIDEIKQALKRARDVNASMNLQLDSSMKDTLYNQMPPKLGAFRPNHNFEVVIMQILGWIGIIWVIIMASGSLNDEYTVNYMDNQPSITYYFK